MKQTASSKTKSQSITRPCFLDAVRDAYLEIKSNRERRTLLENLTNTFGCSVQDALYLVDVKLVDRADHDSALPSCHLPLGQSTCAIPGTMHQKTTIFFYCRADIMAVAIKDALRTQEKASFRRIKAVLERLDGVDAEGTHLLPAKMILLAFFSEYRCESLFKLEQIESLIYAPLNTIFRRFLVERGDGQKSLDQYLEQRSNADHDEEAHRSLTMNKYLAFRLTEVDALLVEKICHMTSLDIDWSSDGTVLRAPIAGTSLQLSKILKLGYHFELVDQDFAQQVAFVLHDAMLRNPTSRFNSLATNDTGSKLHIPVTISLLAALGCNTLLDHVMDLKQEVVKTESEDKPELSEFSCIFDSQDFAFLKCPLFSALTHHEEAMAKTIAAKMTWDAEAVRDFGNICQEYKQLLSSETLKRFETFLNQHLSAAQQRRAQNRLSLRDCWNSLHLLLNNAKKMSFLKKQSY